jgi:hypothetical protein
MLAGGRAYWDRANSKVTWNKATTGAFYIGTVEADAASADATVLINLNARQRNRIQWDDDIFTTALVGSATATRTPSAPLRAGGHRHQRSGEVRRALGQRPSRSPTGRSSRPASPTSPSVRRGGRRQPRPGQRHARHRRRLDHRARLLPLGRRRARRSTRSRRTARPPSPRPTPPSSRVDGTYQEFWIDARDSTNVKLYINAVRVLSGSTFKLNAGTGPMKALVHIEKTTGTTTGSVAVEFLNVRSTDLTYGVALATLNTGGDYLVARVPAGQKGSGVKHYIVQLPRRASRAGGWRFEIF